MESFTNKLIGITGISSGIGAAAAALLTSQGARIIGFDRTVPRASMEAFYPIDLADPDAIAALADNFPHRLDALCNVAGVPPTADKHTVLRVNFFGLRAFTEAMAAHLADHAPIVNVASLAGFLWRDNIVVVKQGLATTFADADHWITGLDVDGAPSYHLSKELVIAWTLFNCQRWRARGIRMNAVSPGPVATPILADFIQTMGQRVADDLKENRAGEPHEIAPIIAFLCSDEARWMNGADVVVDGGAGATAWTQIFA